MCTQHQCVHNTNVHTTPTNQTKKATVYVYQLVDGAVKVEKIEYRKPVTPVTPAAAGQAAGLGVGAL